MSHLVRAYRRALVPLAAYYAVTLALPVANGAARSGMAFWTHALVVLLVPLLAIALGSSIHVIVMRYLTPGPRNARRCTGRQNLASPSHRFLPTLLSNETRSATDID